MQVKNTQTHIESVCVCSLGTKDKKELKLGNNGELCLSAYGSAPVGHLSLKHSHMLCGYKITN